jgi:hypothetical protein
MEMKKLHLGTMSYGVDSMDEVALQLATALGEEKSIRSFPFLPPCPFLLSSEYIEFPLPFPSQV